MRNDYKSAVIGIVLVLLIALGYVSFCRVVDRAEASVPQHDDGSDDGGNITYTTSYADRGYIAYDKLPEAYGKLLESNVFVPTEADLWEYEDFMEAEYPSKADFLESRISEYDSEADSLKTMGNASFLEQAGDNMVVSPRRTSLRRCINWDNKAGKFKETELFAAIENCGFSGFTGFVSEVERQLKEQRSEDDEYYSSDEYIIYCRKGIFVISQTYLEQDIYELSLVVNNAHCYIPEKYKNMIDSVNAGGDYFLYSTCVGGKRDVLVFCRDNTVCDASQATTAVKSGAGQNKRIAFVFEEGKLVDYYAVTTTTALQLDEIDKKLIDTYASGLGKTLSGRGETGSAHGPWCLYRSK